MPVTPDEFRQLALSFPSAVENAHMNHPDFRVGGKIFATLGYPNETCGMVRLPPEYQHEFSMKEPKAFIPVKGTWGKQGATTVMLKTVTKNGLKEAMQVAWRARQAKQPKVARSRRLKEGN